MRRALQYGAVTGRRIALHCEERPSRADGQMHEGARLGGARLRRLSVGGREPDGRARPRARRLRGPAAAPPASLRARIGRGAAPRARGRRAASGEVTPHHLCLTDEAVRSLDPNVKMNPPLRAESDRTALLEGLQGRDDRAIATDHAPHARHEKEVPFEAAPFGVTGLETAFAALYTHLVEPGLAPARDAARADVRRPGAHLRARRAAHRGRRAGEPRPPRPERELARRPRTASARGRRTRGCSAQTLKGTVRATVAAGQAGVRGMTGFLALEDGTVFRGESVARRRRSRSARRCSRPR